MWTLSCVISRLAVILKESQERTNLTRSRVPFKRQLSWLNVDLTSNNIAEVNGTSFAELVFLEELCYDIYPSRIGRACDEPPLPTSAVLTSILKQFKTQYNQYFGLNFNVNSFGVNKAPQSAWCWQIPVDHRDLDWSKWWDKAWSVYPRDPRAITGSVYNDWPPSGQRDLEEIHSIYDHPTDIGWSAYLAFNARHNLRADASPTSNDWTGSMVSDAHATGVGRIPIAAPVEGD
uniref:Uncharacterized protein n=1 Tax=Timema monikensis TaxID=170555 RepID=A0A7R9E9A0_9NEOP|nr:unnamed protein product [Timema monikensis]